MSGTFEITYAAHTATCTFLLDAEGICRRVIAAPSSSGRSLRTKGRDASNLGARCVGAQYVASLDPSIAGMLAEKPRVGAAMLFARVDERGRISLVRTGAVTRFEKYQAEDPFESSDVPSVSVETSAPVITPAAPTARFARQTIMPEASESSKDRTQPFHNLRPADLLRLHAMATHDEDEDDDLDQDDDALARTREYRSEGTARKTWPSAGVDLEPPSLPTLRQPPAALGAEPPAADGADDPYASPAMATTRGPLPRPSVPAFHSPRTRSDRVARAPDPPARAAGYPHTDRLGARRRGER